MVKIVRIAKIKANIILKTINIILYKFRIFCAKREKLSKRTITNAIWVYLVLNNDIYFIIRKHSLK
jgi:hypothetical protein